MKILRIKLRQKQASYAKAETVTNTTTYPLPPYSTIIGAIHNACGYTSYHPMDISVQGKYGSMEKEIYINHGLLNNREDDRNILVYMVNPDILSAGVIVVGEGLKGQGNSFRKNLTVSIARQDLYRKYLELFEINDELTKENNEVVKVKEKNLKEKEKYLKNQQKKLDNKSEEYKEINKQIKEIKDESKKIRGEYREKKRILFDQPISHFKTLVKGPQWRETLYDVELVIHIRTEEKTFNDIKANINNFVSLGRSEDFVEIVECKEVLLKKPEEDVGLMNNYKLYADIESIYKIPEFSDENLEESDDKEDSSFLIFFDGDNVENAKGSVYYIDKDYILEDGKRKFNKIACVYSSYLVAMGDSEIACIDDDNYIVALS